jgi:hypothetical protein
METYIKLLAKQAITKIDAANDQLTIVTKTLEASKGSHSTGSSSYEGDIQSEITSTIQNAQTALINLKKYDILIPELESFLGSIDKKYTGAAAPGAAPGAAHGAAPGAAAPSGAPSAAPSAPPTSGSFHIVMVGSGNVIDRGEERDLQIDPASAASGKRVEWKSNNFGTVSVNKNGHIKGSKTTIGDATITATINGESASIEITVKDPGGGGSGSGSGGPPVSTKIDNVLKSHSLDKFKANINGYTYSGGDKDIQRILGEFKKLINAVTLVPNDIIAKYKQLVTKDPSFETAFIANLKVRKGSPIDKIVMNGGARALRTRHARRTPERQTYRRSHRRGIPTRKNHRLCQEG